MHRVLLALLLGKSFSFSRRFVGAVVVLRGCLFGSDARRLGFALDAVGFFARPALPFHFKALLFAQELVQVTLQALDQIGRVFL